MRPENFKEAVEVRVKQTVSGGWYVRPEFATPEMLSVYKSTPEAIEKAVGERFERDNGYNLGYQGGVIVFFEREDAALDFAEKLQPFEDSARKEIRDFYAEEEEDNIREEQKLYGHLNEWDKKYPHGRRISFDCWGRGSFKSPSYAVQKDALDSPEEVVTRAIARKSKCSCWGGIRCEGTNMADGKPEADVYTVTIGNPCGNAMSVEAQVWFAIPVEYMRQ